MPTLSAAAFVVVFGATLWYAPLLVALATAIAAVVGLNILRKRLVGEQIVDGSVFITGCDPGGIGERTALLFAERGFHVYAGVLFDASRAVVEAKLRAGSKGSLVAVQLDITKEDQVRAAVASVQADIARNKAQKKGLVAVVNVAALGYSGPVEYFPVERFKHQITVNLVGPYTVCQHFMPLLRASLDAKSTGRTRARMLFFGTGGGVPSPAPPLLSAYMASKWGCEAVCQSLRVECQLRGYSIDCGMINPGYIKPTQLGPVGMKLLEDVMKEGGPKALEEYGELLDKFLAFSDAQPGTHPDVVAEAVWTAVQSNDFKLRHKVGFDSKASPFVGLLPTAWRESLLRTSMFSTPVVLSLIHI